MLMLRYALIMFLSSLIQNRTVAPLEEWETSCQKLEEWEASCHLHVQTVSNWDNNITLDHLGFIGAINGALNVFLYEMNKFPIDGMDELLKHRLKEPLENAISNCNKLLNKLEHSGREDNQKYRQHLLSRIHSIAKGIDEELNTFIFEVKLELIKKVNWTTSGNNSNQCESSKQSYSNSNYFAQKWLLISSEGMGDPRYEPGTPEFVEYLGTLILNAKLIILEKELTAKIALFVEQQPHIDGDGFVEFSRNFKLEWKKIEQNLDQLKSFDDIEHYRRRLNDLAESAMNGTAPIKGIITKKLNQLVTKCHNAKLDGPVIAMKKKGSVKNLFNGLDQLFKSDRKKQIKAKNNEINAKKDIISDIGMFDGAAFNVLIRFEHVELDSNDFCAELEKAVEQDKEMVLQAYQVKNVDE